MPTEILAEIVGLKYTPLLCSELDEVDGNELKNALANRGQFILEVNAKNKIAVSCWVSPKRTRSYPYARVYDTLGFSGKKVTIIPVVKDEGFDGDRDFLQWDTISLMSLLGVYVIIAYYVHADKNPRYQNKITNQRFSARHVQNEIKELLSYQSDALHWNLSRIDNIAAMAEAALQSYDIISEKLGVKMHSRGSALRRIEELDKGRTEFMDSSRERARKAQQRESVTDQPKERLEGEKARITITNYLGGKYYFTCDEVEVHGDEVYLVEAKHTETDEFPKEGDIKDGLLKLALFTNLRKVTVEGHQYRAAPFLKLTTRSRKLSLSDKQANILESMKKEAALNGFGIRINGRSVNLT